MLIEEPGVIKAVGFLYNRISIDKNVMYKLLMRDEFTAAILDYIHKKVYIDNKVVYNIIKDFLFERMYNFSKCKIKFNTVDDMRKWKNTIKAYKKALMYLSDVLYQDKYYWKTEYFNIYGEDFPTFKISEPPLIK